MVGTAVSCPKLQPVIRSINMLAIAVNPIIRFIIFVSLLRQGRPLPFVHLSNREREQKFLLLLTL